MFPIKKIFLIFVTWKFGWYKGASDWSIGLMSSIFANGLEDQGSIPGQVLPKTQNMVLDSALRNTQHYKLRIKGKVEQSREWSSILPYASV